jgi:tetratricopeptide (TPR) repeat protein
MAGEPLARALSPRRRAWLLVCLLLVAANAAVFAPVLSFDFIHYDDPLYVTANPYIRGGVTRSGVRWVLTHEHGGSWHPLTGLSHMLDCELFGLRSGGHHLTSLVLHAANSLFLFGMLEAATGAVWLSAIAALLFAIHPLHVEPVAWVSGRKDVLSTCFAFLAMWAYVGYARYGAWRRYLAALGLFALALMAKPMLVTLPLVLLLLDYWPLDRFEARGESPEGTRDEQGDRSSEPEQLSVATATGEGHEGARSDTADRSQAPEPRPAAAALDADRESARGLDAADRTAASNRRPPAALVIEKLPFLALAACVSAVTYLGHRSAGTLAGGEGISLGQRLANALVSYARYVGKAVWPVDLAVHYPHPNLPGGVPWARWQVASAGAFLVIVSVWVLRRRRECPYALAGWLWYLVTLLPVLGLVQVGRHAMADRYTYVPLVGLGIAVVWAAADAERRWGLWTKGRSTLLFGTLAAAAVTALMMPSASQVQYWRDTVSLLEHALAVAPDAPEMHWTLGRELREQGRLEEAIGRFRRALAIRPEYPDAEVDLGLTLWAQGRAEEAIVHYERALRAAPHEAGTHNALGVALQAQGRTEEAMAQFREALRLRPAYPEAHTNLGIALHGAGDLDQAARHYREALRLDPQRVEARINLAHVLAARGDLDEAILQYQAALETDGGSGAVHLALARALHASRRLDEAILHYRQALERGADEVETWTGLGLALFRQGKAGEAIEHYRRALEIRPGDAVLHNRLGKTLQAAGRTEEAIAQYREAVRIRRDFANAHRNLAVALESVGRIEEARAHYAQAGPGGGGREGERAGAVPPSPP